MKEALKLIADIASGSTTANSLPNIERIAREALAQPAQRSVSEHLEPVAYIKAAELDELKHCNGMSLWAENAAIHTDDSISKQLLPSGHVPVYTTPPQRKPLTDEQINQIANEYGAGGWICDFARAIEAAHGIKEST